jgi:hypothetical protein
MNDDEERPKPGLKLLSQAQRDNMSDSTRAGSSPPRNRQSLIEIPYVEDYIISPYRIYFNVTTEQVWERIKDSIVPFGKRPIFGSGELESPVDLYGPLWIYFSLNV